jgi:hypothetical protein
VCLPARPTERSIRLWPHRVHGDGQFLARLLRREQPSTFHRCLAVHLYFASARGGLS